MNLTDDQHPANTQGLWRLGAAASSVGLTGKQLASACLNRRIPVSLVVLGERSRYVNAAEFNAWRASLTAPRAEENLFN
ncbi:hypothetical protein [Ramlibacter alkalitolerans]|uniref:DNA-binding protein n=1 Tax=Ramlibacter alkalitolerans TaxID=2039631 RepID=A0ABS1JUV3_9BURK|nr:hypothetical protein [Ramlibacter alkalitolerans]MBL0427941.1 hypothetical protein [Ramlibacter alkalitolerans]